MLGKRNDYLVFAGICNKRSKFINETIKNNMFDFNTIQFVDIIEFIGTFAFAISGVRLASAKKFDLFGAFVVGLVTAVGGGTLRDLLFQRGD